ncbi:hypothetical protein HYZ98_00540 [Candidatus Peregrinibacteria bacterium]|nr:hypothetical protein [Candidatus Peregrinibacteria bacterium]
MGKLSPSENQHHNVPGSRGGSGRGINISVIPEKRHEGFHVWSCNRTPEMLMRKMLIRAIGLEGKHALPLSALEDLFGETGVSDWTDLYDPDAVIWLCGKGDKEHVAKARDYAVEHWVEELSDTRWTINSLLYRRYFPVAAEDDDREFLRQAMMFFQTNSPQAAVQTLLTEKYKNELLWVKPLKDTVRRKLLTVLGCARPVSIGYKEEGPLVDMLKEHEMRIVSGIVHERSR